MAAEELLKFLRLVLQLVVPSKLYRFPSALWPVPYLVDFHHEGGKRLFRRNQCSSALQRQVGEKLFACLCELQTLGRVRFVLASHPVSGSSAMGNFLSGEREKRNSV